MGRIRLVVVAVLVALVAAGCKVDTTATITLQPDGTGTVAVNVVLDASAVGLVQRGGGTLEHRIVLTGLTKAGWTLSRWKRARDGSAALAMTHAFHNTNELAQALTDLTGPSGVVTDVHIDRVRNAFETRDGVSLTVDLGALRTGVRADKQLAAKLKGAGINVDQVDFVLGGQLRDAFTLTVDMAVPRRHNAQFEVPAGERDALSLSSSKFQWSKFATVLIGGMLVFLSLLLYLSASISARRRRSRALQFAASRAGRSSDPLM